ncbi:MAG: O-antigen ligase family protein [Actinomycetota bacterium]
MRDRGVPLRSVDVFIGAVILVVSVIAAVFTGHWTVLLVPIIWSALAWLSTAPLLNRFAALVAATVLIPRYPLRIGFSLDDIVPAAAALCAIVLLVVWRPPRMPRPVEIAFAVWILAAAGSAIYNGHSTSSVMKLAANGVGRPVLWLLVVWTAYAATRKYGLRVLLIPIAVVAIIESVFVISTYAHCTEIHIGAVSEPTNRAVWESRRGLGVEQGAGTNVGVERIRCRATGTLGQSSNFLAAYFVTTLPVLVGATLISTKAEGSKINPRWIYLAGTILAVVGLFLTFTRAALPAGAAAVFITLAFAAPRRVLPILLIAAVVVAAFSFAVPQIRRRLTDQKADRLALWYSGLLIFKDHPLFGVGFGNYTTVQRSKPKYLKTPYGTPTSTSHNGFIGIAAEGGAFQAGAVLFLAVFVVVSGARASARARGTPEAALVAAAFGGACGFLAQNMTNTLLLVPAVATYFWLFNGILLGAVAQSEPNVLPEAAQVVHE